MNILKKLNAAILLVLSGAVLTTIPACKKNDSGGGTTASNKVIDKVKADQELSKLKTLVTNAKLEAKLAEAGPYTLLAPVNDAFTAYGIDPTKLDADISEVLIMYHTLAGKYLSKDIPVGKNTKVLTIATPNNAQDSVFITKLPTGDIYVNGINVDKAKVDIAAGNGVIHKLNSSTGLLFPPFNDALTYIQKKSTGNNPNGLDSLGKAVSIAKQALPQLEILLKNSVVTIAAPTNKAFQDFFAAQPTLKQLSDFTPQSLLELLGDHVILGREFIINVAFATSPAGGGKGVDTYLKAPLKFSGNPVALYLNPGNAADLVVPDIAVTNGVVHKIGKILIR